jgi:RNA polymerase sigma-70 factor (ECF subfamily)
MRAATWLNEYNIIKAVLAGDKPQYIELVQRYQKHVFALICRITNSRAQSEELTCYAFVNAYRNLHKFNFTCKFENWVYIIGLYLALDFMKSKGNADEPSDSMYVCSDEAQAQEQEQALQKAEQRLLLRKAIAQLSRAQQAVIYLKYFEDLPYEEISERLGLPENKIKNVIYKSRQQLKNQLTAWDYFA